MTETVRDLKEKTGPQLTAAPVGTVLIGTPGGNFYLPRTAGATYSTYRDIRKDPTTALVRTLITSGIVSAGWSTEKDDDAPDDWRVFIQGQMKAVRAALVEAAVLGGVDFGWSPFEKCFRVEGGRIVIDKVKPLLQDITNIFVDARGNFTGFDQPWGQSVFVPFGDGRSAASRALLFPWRVEGTNWYGYPLLENVRDVFAKWTTAEEHAETFDEKVAGSRLVVYYPPGKTKVDGVDTPNETIAQTIIDTLDASGSVGVPTTVANYVDALDKRSTGWRIESIRDKGPAPVTLERLEYLDVLKVRGMGMPERTILHGAQEGAKAGSETAQTFAIRNLEAMASYVAKIVNAFLVDQLLTLNYGPDAKGRVYVVASPIQDETREFLADIAADVLKSQPSLADMDSIFDYVGIPKSADTVKPSPGEGETG